MDADLVQMQKKLADYQNALFKEVRITQIHANLHWFSLSLSAVATGILDSQYLELHELQDESNPEFVVEVVYLFLADSEKLLDDLSRDLTQQNVEFEKAQAQAQKMKGSSCSIGAPRIKNACIEFQKFCQEKNIRGCLRYLQQMKQEFDLVKSKLKALFALEQNVVAAGGSIPKMQPIDLID
ncbi:hypothetical protein EUGRSUZ_H03655 [Eucalyptus grandis]|uniref:Uncharacterized protein n=2 Tax=Eucalyptus grandis TaxID=71139 RepID=A0ACC3JUL8_EUCGR|nr:hypothetical protein EUGRSUZ_H03655 [Eucalyptus grandis]